MMKKNNDRDRQIGLLQESLSSIRKIAGWSAEKLGDEIGVSKQTISNIERKRTPMTLAQYMAIRNVLDLEIINNKENTVLPQVVNILLDSGDELDEENYNDLKTRIAAVSASAAGGTSGADLDMLFNGALVGAVAAAAILPIIGVAAAPLAIGLIPWMKKISKNNEPKVASNNIEDETNEHL